MGDLWFSLGRIWGFLCWGGTGNNLGKKGGVKFYFTWGMATVANSPFWTFSKPGWGDHPHCPICGSTPAYSVLGHVSFEDLSECLSCHVSKSIALPFNRSIACNKDALDLVHTFSDLPPNPPKEAVFIDAYAR